MANMVAVSTFMKAITDRLCSCALVYVPQFFADFGPLNLACVVRFCRQLAALLRDPAHAGKLVVYHSSPHPHRCANSALLVCLFAMVELGRNAVQAYAPFVRCDPPLVPFRDAAFAPCTFPLTVLECVRGVARAMSLGHFRPQAFDVDEYLRLDKVLASWVVVVGGEGPSPRVCWCALPIQSSLSLLCLLPFPAALVLLAAGRKRRCDLDSPGKIHRLQRAAPKAP